MLRTLDGNNWPLLMWTCMRALTLIPRTMLMGLWHRIRTGTDTDASVVCLIFLGILTFCLFACIRLLFLLRGHFVKHHLLGGPRALVCVVLKQMFWIVLPRMVAARAILMAHHCSSNFEPHAQHASYTLGARRVIVAFRASAGWRRRTWYVCYCVSNCAPSAFAC